MILLLDNSIEKVIEGDIEDTKEMFINLALWIKSGRHIVLADKKLLAKLINLDSLPNHIRRIYNSLYKKINLIYGIIEKVKGYAIITNSIDITCMELINDKIVYYVPFGSLGNIDSFAEIRLISENNSDCDFYKNIAKKYIQEYKIGCDINIKNIAGGGDQTATVYEEEMVNNQSICIAIVDSDKKYKGDSIKDTSRKVKSIYEQNKSKYVTDLYILDVREKENLVPTTMYEWCYSSKMHEESIRYLKFLEKSNDLQDLYKYCDIKDGITISELFKCKDNYNLLNQYLHNQILKFTLNEDIDMCFLIYLNDILQGLLRCEGFNELINGITSISNPHLDISIEDANNIISNYIKCCSKREQVKASKEVFIHGIGSLINEFKNDILEQKIQERIKEKENVIIRNYNPGIENELKKLNFNYIKSQIIFGHLPEYLYHEWSEIANTIITWGCNYKIKSA